jgi:hypothetical protein
MSSSKAGGGEKNHGEVEVRSKFGPVRIELFDHQLSRVAIGFGHLKSRVAAGVYSLQYSAGTAHGEDLIRVESGRSVTKEVDLPFPAVAPISASTTTHEFHTGPAMHLSRHPLMNYHGVGGCLMIFVRTVDGDGRAPVPVEQLSLRDAALRPVGNLAADAQREDDYGWAALCAEVKPGGYALRWEPPPSRPTSKRGGTTPQPVDQSLWVSPGWATMVFIAHRSEPRELQPVAAALGPNHPLVHNAGPGVLERQSASIHMTQLGRGFDPGPDAWAVRSGQVSEGDLREAQVNQALDLALAGLRTGTPIVPDDLLDLLLQSKFKNPMLGIVGAHALLQRREPNWKLFDLVVQNLERVTLGHPDVAALRLLGKLRRGRETGTKLPPLAWPPMIYAGYRGVIERDWQEQSSLIAEGSLAERAAATLLLESPWTCWQAVEMREPPPALKPQPKPRAKPKITLPNLSRFIEFASDPETDEGRTVRQFAFAAKVSADDLFERVAETPDPAVERVSRHIASLREMGEDVDLSNLSLDSFRQTGLPVSAVEKAIQTLMSAPTPSAPPKPPTAPTAKPSATAPPPASIQGGPEMTTFAPAAASNAGGLTFKRSQKFLEGAANVGLQINAAGDQQVAAALVADQPFPDRMIELGSISVSAEAGEKIVFGEGRGKVSFGAHAGASAGIGVYPQPQEMLKTLKRAGLNDPSAPGLNFEADAAHSYVLLRWGYDLGAAATGALALGASVKFGVEAEREGLYAVVRRLPKTTGARTALGKAVASWALPRQIKSPADIEPGTWVIAEVEGSVAVKVGAKYGYEFNWVREAVSLGGLTGDVGLRVQLGVAATLGFSASGQYSVVVSRESLDPESRTLRLRLFKLRKKGWDFAFNAGATVQGDFDQLLPPNFSDFVAAVFNVNALQVLKDLEKWTNPDSKLADLLGAELVDEANELLAAVTGVDPKTQFNAARGRLQGFIKQWHALPHDAASAVYKIVKEHSPGLAAFRDTLGRFAKAAPANAAGLFGDALSRVDFFQTPAGMWLEAVAERGVMSLLSDVAEIKKAQEVARKTLAVLDGSVVEAALKNFQAFVDSRLRIDKLQQFAATDFDKVDKWLKARLAAFLDKQLSELKLEDLEKVRKVVHTLFSKQEEFYRQAKEALTRKYEFEFIGKYQKSTASTALVDVEFDFKPDGASSDNALLTGLLQGALGGNLDAILVNRHDGVRLNQGVLTHEIKRSSHVEVTLPYFHSELDHINRSLASARAVDADGERLLVYDLDAEDVVTRRNVRDSRLSLGAQITAGGVRVHRAAGEADGFRYSYTFRQAVRDMKRAHLQYQLKSYVESYFAGQFGGERQPFDTWVGDLDTAIEEAEHNGKDNFGHTLIALEVSVPGAAVAAWQSAPAEKKARAYMDMSRALQAKLRQLIPFSHFQNPERYRDLAPSYALLVYSSLPVSTNIKQEGGALALNRDTDVYWDWVSDELREKVVRDPRTVAALGAKAAAVQSMLAALGGFGSVAGHYAPGEVSDMLHVVLNTAAGKALLKSLLAVEVEVIKGARDAGLALAKFLSGAKSKPTEAVKALAEFGEKLTDTFNNKIDSVYQGEALRPLGTMAFLEAARALNPAAGEGASAMLDLIVLKQASQFPPGDFLRSKQPAAQEVARHERLISLA